MPERKEERFETDLAIRFEGGQGVAHNVSANGIYYLGGPIAANCVARVVRLEERGAKRGVGASIGSFEMRRVAPGKSSKS
jgi:hypothetical protein